MSSSVPPRLPKDIITILTVLFVVLVVSFPASSSQIAVLIFVGGGVFLLLSSKTWQKPADGQAPSASTVPSVLLARLAAQRAEEEKGTTETEHLKGSQSPAGSLKATQDSAVGNAPKQQQILSNGVSTSLPEAVTSPTENRAAQSSDGTATARRVAKPVKGTDNARTPPLTDSQAGGPPLAGGAAVLARLR